MTCCGKCGSLGGAAYFLTSVQIFLGLHLFLKWAVIPIIKIQVEDLVYFEDRQQILYPLLLIYFTVFIVLGCINFLAIQEEAGKVLQWATRLLLILQILELGSHILLGFILPDEETEDADMSRVWHLQRFGLSLTGSLVYFIILFKYSGTLVKGTYPTRKEESFELEDLATGYNPMNDDIIREELLGMRQISSDPQPPQNIEVADIHAQGNDDDDLDQVPSTPKIAYITPIAIHHRYV